MPHLSLTSLLSAEMEKVKADRDEKNAASALQPADRRRIVQGKELDPHVVVALKQEPSCSRSAARPVRPAWFSSG